MRKVYYHPRTRPSGRVLAKALAQAGYRGKAINWGYSLVDGYNANAGRYSKRQALERMIEAGVPTPRLYTINEITERSLPVIGRTERHWGGNGLWLCKSLLEVELARRSGATHFLSFIENAREFRVHVAFGKSIKIAEKIGGRGHVRNVKHGYYFAYPDFNHKQTLRRVAKEAVLSSRLDFGAVDVLYSEGKFYVLEVNSAPSLTSRSDALERYVKAFLREG